MAALFDSRGVLCYISEWRRFLIAGCSLLYIRVAALFDSRGVLCYISEWRRFLIAGVVSAIYPSGGAF